MFKIKTFKFFKVYKAFNRFKRIVCEDTGEVCSSYPQYLKSKHWKLFKKKFDASSHYTGRCLICPNTKRLHHHHITYDNIGKELLKDIVTLCKKCHRRVHSALKKGKTWAGIIKQL